MPIALLQHQKEVLLFFCKKRGILWYVNHPFLYSLASIFTNLLEVRDLSSSCIGWAYAFHMTGLWRLKSGLQLQHCLVRVPHMLYQEKTIVVLPATGQRVHCERFIEETWSCFTSLSSERCVHCCALDNLDHNPSATTALSSFHGTGISLFQLLTKENHGETIQPVTIPPLPGTLCLTTMPLSQLYL